MNDYDDVVVLKGPTVFSGALPELYLIDTHTNTRTFFRWNVTQDP